MKVQIFTLKGTKTGELELPKEVFGVKPNLNMLAQAVHVYEERSHGGLRKTQTRSEVNRTTKKLYKQKGTGGARHGSRRAPIFVGGGVALGPRPERRILDLPQALKAKAKAYAFSLKASEKEVVAVSGIDKIAKTKEAGEFLKKLGSEVKAKRFTFILSDKAAKAFRFLRNLGNANVVSFKDASALDIFKGGIIVLDEDIFGNQVKGERQEVKEDKKPVVKKAVKKPSDKVTK